MKNTLGRRIAMASSKIGAFMSVGFAAAMSSLTAFADNSDVSTPDLEKVTAPIIGILETVLNVMIPVVAAVGAIFCVFLGIKYSRAEELQEREKAKSHLKAAIIGFVLVFVLIVALRIATPLMTDWMNNNS